MIDVVQLRLKAGDGGAGRVSFLRQKFRPKGGPDGGHGGRGGNVVVQVNPNLNTLQHLSGITEFVAEPGQIGGSEQSTGRHGHSITIEVPPGTKVWLVAENKASRFRRLHTAREGNLTAVLHNKKYTLATLGQAIPHRPVEELELVDESLEPLLDVTEADQPIVRTQSLKQQNLSQLLHYSLGELLNPGDSMLLCRGGNGGKGNISFKGPERTTPLVAEYGVPGEEKIIIFELRLLADVGLVGLPNAGKSTFLARVTRANPKIASYPFTTTEPQLGMMQVPGNREVVIADLPGIIEGARQGKGLGYTFLRHIAECRVLVMFLSPIDESGQLVSDVEGLVEWLTRQYRLLKNELISYDPTLADRPLIPVISKIDLLAPEVAQSVQEKLQAEIKGVQGLSSANGAGLNELSIRITKYF